MVGGAAWSHSWGRPNADRDRSALYNSVGGDVRNADGLIVGSDMTTGFWVFRMEGFNGWSGAQWGLPERSSVQDWEATPGQEE